MESSIHEPEFMRIYYDERDDKELAQEVVCCKKCGDLFIIFHDVLKPQRIYPLRRYNGSGAIRMLGYIVVGTPNPEERRHRWPGDREKNYAF